MPRNSKPVVRLKGVSKKFGDIIANEQIDLEIRAGEVHCLLGENGAGKSTLISMLAGMHVADEGTIEIAGLPRDLTSPSAAIEQGIGVVYQHSELVLTMTVLENLMLDDSKHFWLDRTAAKRALASLGESLGVRIDANTRVEELSLGQRQQLEIAKVVSRNPKVLVLDEPTSMLGEQAVNKLKQTVERLKREGVGVLFVTHKLEEALAVGDRVTVLRAGRVVLRVDSLSEPNTAKSASEEILTALFGEDARHGGASQEGVSRSTQRHEVHERREAAEALRAEGLNADSDSGLMRLRDVSFTLRKGEVLGVAGVDGQGQSLLAEAVYGQRKTSGGKVVLCGRDVSRVPVSVREELGLRYVTDDRLNEGIVGSMSVELNLLLKQIGKSPFWRFARLNRGAVAAHSRRLIEDFSIRAPSPQTPAATLSGGNIQRLLLARELSTGARVVVFNKPSYGLDSHMVHLVHEKIRDFVQQGGAALVISTDLDELLALSTNIAVMAGGRMVGQVPNEGENVRARLGALITGSLAA